MRLSSNEISSIKEIFFSIFKSGEIFLFGSRVDDSLRGGDIDLFIQTDDKNNILEKKIQFLSRLKSKIGDQKIDLIISKDKTRTIEKEAIKYGVKL